MTATGGNGERWAGILAVMMTTTAAFVTGSTPIRLANGTRTVHLYAGRLEVFYNGTWGTVCDDGFTERSAAVICFMLGFRWTHSVYAGFGAGNGTIWLDEVDCTGRETDISQCRHADWGMHDCNHHKDVGVVCFRPKEKSTGTPVGLVHGFRDTYSSSGRLKVNYNGTWGTVCDDSFTLTTVRVICGILGFSSGYILAKSPFGTENRKILLARLICTGEETDMSMCYRDEGGVNGCNHDKEVSLICLKHPDRTPGTSVRLIGGFGDDYHVHGRLQVYYNDTWGTVCEDAFTVSTATVICRLLGFSEGIPFPRFTRRENEPFSFSSVECSGDETDILQCKLSEAHSCRGRRVSSLLCALPLYKDDFSTSTKIPDTTQTSTIVTRDSVSDKRALIVGLAVGLGEAVLVIIIGVVVVVIRRCRYSQGRGRSDTGVKGKTPICETSLASLDKNAVFVAQRNRARAEVVPEKELPASLPHSEFGVSVPKHDDVFVYENVGCGSHRSSEHIYTAIN